MFHGRLRQPGQGATPPGPGSVLTLPRILERLAARYGTPRPPPTEPFRLILWENAGYLVPDQTRFELLENLESAVGLSPAALAAAPLARIAAAIASGGMGPARRAAKVQDAAVLVQSEVGGDLAAALVALPPAAARKLLKRFPGIGDPGADKVLLFAGIVPGPAVDSNGLRVLERLGRIAAGIPYAKQYREASALLESELPADFETRQAAFGLLQAHGRELCKRAAPICEPCPLQSGCEYFASRR